MISKVAFCRTVGLGPIYVDSEKLFRTFCLGNIFCLQKVAQLFGDHDSLE